jgi:hypothetical protein
VAGVIGAVALAPTAQADPEFQTYGSINDHNGYAFAAEMAVFGEYETAEQATTLGYGICGMRAAGFSEEELRHRAEIKYSISLVVEAVDGAEFHFCPAYEIDSQTGGPLWPQYVTPPPQLDEAV